MKSKELKIHNLPADDYLISQIDAKPNYFFIILLFIGFASFLLKIPFIYGVVSIVTSLILLFATPKVVLIQFFNDYLVMYNKADRNTCVLIYYDEVSSWNYSWGANRDYLFIELENGQTERIEGFSKTLFENQMNRFLKDKHKKVK